MTVRQKTFGVMKKGLWHIRHNRTIADVPLPDPGTGNGCVIPSGSQRPRSRL
jgi:hypothetical protein